MNKHKKSAGLLSIILVEASGKAYSVIIEQSPRLLYDYIYSLFYHYIV